jgi:hypothetical protein
MNRAIVVFEVSGYTTAIAAGSVHWVLPLKQGDPGPHTMTMFGRRLTPLHLECLLEIPRREFQTDSTVIVLKDLSMGVLALRVGRLVELLFIAPGSAVPVERENFLNGCVAGVVLFEGRKIHLLSSLRLLEKYERLHYGFSGVSGAQRFATQ